MLTLLDKGMTNIINEAREDGVSKSTVLNIKRILVRHALEGRTLTYTELNERLGKVFKAPNDHRLKKIIQNLSLDSYEKHNVLLSSVIVKNNGRALPGDGFFSLANRLYNIKIIDRTEFWLNEFSKTIKAYRSITV